VIDSAVILAVTTPTHESQLREQRPRAMLPALGKPMVVRVMERLYRAGIRRYIVIVGINEGPVASYLNKQWMPDAKVEFILQGNESLSLLLARIARQLDEPFMIASYHSFTFERFMHSLVKQAVDNPEPLILTGAHLSLSPDAPSNHFALMNGTSVQEVVNQKPSQANFYLTEHAVCGYHFVEYLKSMDDKAASNVGKTWFEIVKKFAAVAVEQIMIAETSWILRVESDKDLLTLNKKLLEESNDAHILSELPYTVKVIPPVRIDPQVSVGQGAVIGPYVYVERGSSIGYGAKIKNTLVLERGNVPSEANVDGGIVTSRGVVKA
jgi:NDP-sugar pyrophosphorylase family protein